MIRTIDDMGSSCVKIHTWPFRRGSKVVNNGDITSTLITKPNGKRLSSSTSTNLGCSHHVQLRIEVYHQNASPALPPCKQQHETHPSSSPLHTNTNTTPPSESSPFWFGNEDPVHTRCILEHYAEELLEVRKPNSRAPVQFVGQVKRLKLQHKVSVLVRSFSFSLSMLLLLFVCGCSCVFLCFV